MVIGCQLELLTINGAQPLCYLRVGKEENGVISFCLPFRKKKIEWNRNQIIVSLVVSLRALDRPIRLDNHGTWSLLRNGGLY